MRSRLNCSTAALAPRLAVQSPEVRIGDVRSERGGQGRRIRRGHQPTGDAVLDQLGVAADVGWRPPAGRSPSPRGRCWRSPRAIGRQGEHVERPRARRGRRRARRSRLTRPRQAQPCRSRSRSAGRQGPSPDDRQTGRGRAASRSAAKASRRPAWSFTGSSRPTVPTTIASSGRSERPRRFRCAPHRRSGRCRRRCGSSRPSPPEFRPFQRASAAGRTRP